MIPNARGFGKATIKIRRNRDGSRILQEITEIKTHKFERKGDSASDETTHESIEGISGVLRPESIELNHWEELLSSSIDSEIASLNFKSLDGTIPYNYLLYSDKILRTNTGRVNSSYINRYKHLEGGGWWCSGVDILTWEDSLWGHFKPNFPRKDEEGKTIKYEVPPKTETEIFALKVPSRIWELVSRRYDVALPKDFQNLPRSAFWKWVVANAIPIIITEGSKKAAAILSCGYAALALPGVFNGYRQPRNETLEPNSSAVLIPQLQMFAQLGRQIYFCFDQDCKRTTIRNVNQALSKTAILFKKQGCLVNVITWNPLLGKGIDDVLTSYGRETFDNFYREALDFDSWQTRQLKRLTYKPNLSLNQRYLGEFTPPEGTQFICLKSPKGTGKSQWLKYITDPVVRAGTRRILPISHRVQLGSFLCELLGLPFVTELKTIGQGSQFGFGLNIDSLHPNSQARFNPEDWKGAWVILDEVQQLIWHLLNSSTCQKERVIIIKTLKQLLLNVIQYGGKIIIADADLNDISIDFIRGLIGYEIEPWIVENEYQFQSPWTVYQFGGKNPAQLVKHLEKSLEAGEKNFVCLSGQKVNSTYGSRNLESYYRQKFPNLRILRIDSETVSDPKHPAYGCIGKLNSIVKEYDLVLTTATIETGVSIDEEYFDGVWGIFQGVQTTDSVRQHLSRYRPPVPRYVWFSEVGINKVANGSTTVKGLLAGEYKKDKANISKLKQFGFEESINGEFESVALNTWAKLACIINQGMYNYAKQIISDLEDEGHTIIPADCDLNLPDETEVETSKKDIKKNRDVEYQIHREEVVKAGSISDEKYEQLSRQQAKTKQDRLEFQKGKVERKYNIEVTSELIARDDKNWHSQLKLHYYLTVGKKYLPDRDKKVMSNALSNGGGDYFKPDTNRSFIGLKIAAFDFLGIERLMIDDEFSSSHPTVLDIFQKCKQNARTIKEVLGRDFSKLDKPMQLVKELIKLLGLQMPCLRREGSKGNRVRIYGRAAANFKISTQGKIELDHRGRAVEIPDERDSIFAKWLERDELALQKQEASNQSDEVAKEIASDLKTLNYDEESVKSYLVCYSKEIALKSLKYLSNAERDFMNVIIQSLEFSWETERNREKMESLNRMQEAA